MKRVLLWAGLGLLVLSGALLAYVVWFLGRVVVDPVQVRATAQTSDDGLIDVEISTTGAEDGVVITAIDLDRPLRDAWGLKPPTGFALEPMPLEEREKDDKAAADYVAKYNREKVRYAGRLPVRPGTPARLRFTAERPQAASGEIGLTHERGVGMGGAIGFVSVRIGPSPSP